MVRSGISVEVCHVLEEGSEPPKKVLKKEPKVKKEKATPKPRAKKGKKRKRDPYSDTEEEEEWIGQSSSESSQGAQGMSSHCSYFGCNLVLLCFLPIPLSDHFPL